MNNERIDDSIYKNIADGKPPSVEDLKGLVKEKSVEKEGELTLGEIRVRTKFNPSNDSVVQNIKERTAELINYINSNVEAKDQHAGRWISLALTSAEECAQWAVKAATYGL